MISAKVITDSENEFGHRITTMIVMMPRIILAEFNTHRMFSRNSASSRAIPFEKMVKSVQENPFIPIAWQKDHKGMQGTEYLDEEDVESAKLNWLRARDNAVYFAKQLATGEYRDTTDHLRKFPSATKQLCNRLLEPFMWHTVIVTATEFENFFALRCPQYVINVGGGNDLEDDVKARSWKDLMKSPYTGDFDTENVIERLSYNKGQAEIHMMALAEAMWDAYNESTPKQLKAGEWHIPFGDNIDIYKMNGQLHYEPLSLPTTKDQQQWIEEQKIKIATARCARVSYTVVGEEGKEFDYKKDIELHDRLAASGHWSPFEHCAKVMEKNDLNSYYIDGDYNPPHYQDGFCGNFRGWIQYRKHFPGENK